jgi:hypothetical protein
VGATAWQIIRPEIKEVGGWPDGRPQADGDGGAIGPWDEDTRERQSCGRSRDRTQLAKA